MEETPVQNGEKVEGRKKLEKWLNKNLKVQMTDGRTLIGIFVCTDKDRNIILGSCQEYLHEPGGEDKEEPRILGLAMIPGHHIVSICVDDSFSLDTRTAKLSSTSADSDGWHEQSI